MLTTLNLLSPEQKRKARNQKINLLFKNFTVILFFTALLISALMLEAEYTLRNSSLKTSETNYQSSHYFNARLNNINNLSLLINEAKNNHYRWSYLLADIAAATPANVKLSALEINSDKKTLTLRGLALARDDLLILKANLAESELLTDINLPAQNLAEKNNINFIINASLPLEKYYHY
ncbi:hypothetical protein COU00_01715 [Candidatus Falkowbacteria bacterium CG10_big_fil_rev_8_21_14_0_10_43_11]|uniref:Uncharacterized protein n=1 Tax=Candidatus Falkowbacteria bacterium CG10_big_fil_rev_8_21_14_0_10_43_11 TaxID=1974568 RepID=A0A2M6WMC0_9BACT|nr:MAG: hypothetical protein COU00_01715 [Candidatus Falkowbacteria bacterium CG10_big_fil_rev_8_21_14_0_10_43_11]